SLRTEITEPTCDPAIDIEQRLDELEAAAGASAGDFDLFDEGFDRDSARTSLENQLQQCQQQHAQVAELSEKVTPAV
ncbi:MAG: hypothetical protein GWO08_10005, partial [Gammaproteobacteria bacterium]|nr:hypothetical protein [Gammaproteobacteria bacterium]